MRKMRPLRVITIASVVFVSVLAAIYAYLEIQGSSARRMISSEQAWIFYYVDHKILATETRNLAKQRRSHAMAAGLPLLEVLFPGDPDIPPSLAILQPRSIGILNGYVRLEFGGLLLHYGIVVYDEGLEGPGTKKLDEGVWFYSGNGRYPGRFGEKRKGPPSTG